MPGPNSTEMAIHVGHERAGWRGLVVAGVCFIAPAFLIVLACAWAYTRYGTLPAAEGLLRGVKPAIIAIVLQALWGLGRTATRTRLLAAVGLLALAAVAAGLHELVVIFGAGALAALVAWTRSGRGRGRANGLLTLPQGAAGLAATTAGVAPFGVTSLFLVFLKIGSVLFGSGYVLLAFLRADLVVRRGWLTEGQLLDAIAVGQVTPGPVFTTATFVGYLLGGLGGGDRGAVDGRDRRRERCSPPEVPREPGLARPRSRPARPRPPPLALARASLAVEVGHERRGIAIARGGTLRDRGFEPGQVLRSEPHLEGAE